MRFLCAASFSQCPARSLASTTVSFRFLRMSLSLLSERCSYVSLVRWCIGDGSLILRLIQAFSSFMEVGFGGSPVMSVALAAWSVQLFPGIPIRTGIH